MRGWGVLKKLVDKLGVEVANFVEVDFAFFGQKTDLVDTWPLKNVDDFFF